MLKNVPKCLFILGSTYALLSILGFLLVWKRSTVQHRIQVRLWSVLYTIYWLYDQVGFLGEKNPGLGLDLWKDFKSLVGGGGGGVGAILTIITRSSFLAKVELTSFLNSFHSSNESVFSQHILVEHRLFISLYLDLGNVSLQLFSVHLSKLYTLGNWLKKIKASETERLSSSLSFLSETF